MTPQLHREFVKFRNRPDRPTFIGKRFAAYLQGTVLDVGCDQAVLRTIVEESRYAGVGMTEEANIKVNLDQEKLPFENASWDTVLCLDTLEHLDHLHRMCDEVFRVAKRNVIISLPNCWVAARRSLAKGSGSIWQYGLTAVPPPDRHKWFFNTEEACAFFEAQTKRDERSIKLIELVALENRRPLINRIWRRVKYPSKRRYLNLYPLAVVAVFQLGD
jgi:2-polyprenyl-3-methyl-5-hydroxy-6-metoxy-1,4-benzoquinol methylase